MNLSWSIGLNRKSHKTDERVRDEKSATHRNPEEYEEFKRKVHERAQQQAKMRYEKFRQQHEAFQTSGINDIALLLKISVRLIGILLFLFLVFLPVVMAIQYTWINLFLILCNLALCGYYWMVYLRQQEELPVTGTILLFCRANPSSVHRYSSGDTILLFLSGKASRFCSLQGGAI